MSGFRFDQFSVAPMEGFTNFPMRLFLCMSSKVTAMTSPFLKVTRVFPENDLPYDFVPELFDLRDVLPYQLAPQYISGEIDSFLRATDLLPLERTPFIELNCGCPSPNSMGKYAGSGILQDPDYFIRSLERIIAQLGAERFAVKMRVGVISETEFATLLDGLLTLKFARLTIHGRTKKAAYRGKAKWELVEEAALAFEGRVPTLLSGDVVSIESALRAHTIAPHASGVMIGRGLLHNPWIFEELRIGETQAISSETFLLAIYSYLLIQELWQNQPRKLVAKIANGKVGFYAGSDAESWEKQAIELSSIALGVPTLPLDDTDIRVSQLAFDRLKLLWGYLRTSLPEDFAVGRISKSSQATDFFKEMRKSLKSFENSLVIKNIEKNSI